MKKGEGQGKDERLIPEFDVVGKKGSFMPFGEFDSVLSSLFLFSTMWC